MEAAQGCRYIVSSITSWHIGILRLTLLNVEEVKKTPAKKTVADELDNVTGSTEDEFTEAINYIREHELILGEKSLLAAFAPLVVEICKHNSVYSVGSVAFE